MLTILSINIMPVESKNISISVYEKNKDKIKKSDNSSQEYIIIQNEELNNKNRDYIIQISEKDTKIEELEIDNDKMETRLQNMRGVLHNFSSKIKKLDQIIIYNENKYKELKDYTKTINNFIKSIANFPKLYSMFTTGFLVILYIIGFISLWEVFVYTILNMIKYTAIYIYIESYNDVLRNNNTNTENMNKILVNYNNNIKVIKSEIEEIDRSNNFIEEYIDNI